MWKYLLTPILGLAIGFLAAIASAQTVTPIADIQANPIAFEGQVVTIEAQVYIPSNYRGTLFSGYVQDSSGRGINLFGSEANHPALFDVANIVRVTGTVMLFFTTVEITALSEVTLLSSGNPPISPAVLSTGQAASSDWEGTYIEASGPIVSKTTAGSAINYTVNDGSGPVVIRVVDALGATEFNVGQTITGRGAGSHFQADFQIQVGRASEVFEGSGGPDTTAPTIANVAAPNSMTIHVTFSELVSSATAENVGNYEVFETAMPSNTAPVSGATLGADLTTVFLTMVSALSAGVDYTVRVNGVEDEAGNGIDPNSTISFTFMETPVTAIADIQANPSAFVGQEVTVQGQVYIPTDYRNNSPSIGYIQDGSGRGISLFGDTTNDAALQDTGNVVRVTGSVEIFFTTVEMIDLTEITLISAGNAPLPATVLSTGAAASSAWEGTYIETSGMITAKATAGAAINYTVNDGSGPLVIRVVDTLNAAEFSLGQLITGRGAGSQFQSDFQILIGLRDNVFDRTVSIEGRDWSEIKNTYR